MIIITGSVYVNDATRREILKACVEHSQRSRDEIGCLSHNVHIDCENMHHLTFFETWRDRASVLRHFAKAEARDFVRTISAKAEIPPEIRIYDSSELTLAELSG